MCKSIVAALLLVTGQVSARPYGHGLPAGFEVVLHNGRPAIRMPMPKPKIKAPSLVAASNSWPDPRGNMVGVPSSGGVVLTQFTSGAGTYTWNKPSNLQYVLVIGIGPGGPGGSGGYGTSDSGGGGGTYGVVAASLFSGSSLNSTETVTLTKGNGGAFVTSNGNGNNGDNTAECSFGAAARNLLRIGANTISRGGGGTNASGGGGSNSAAGWSPLYANALIGATVGGGAGDDTGPGGSSGDLLPISAGGGFVEFPSIGSGGGGGTNGGANFTAGGSVANNIINVTTSVTVRLGIAGGAINGADGQDGSDGGYGVDTAVPGHMMIAGGQSGSGGAGGEGGVVNGGRGGNGGNCGGGGGGGGSSESGAHSGKGGDGGACCVFVFSYTGA